MTIVAQGQVYAMPSGGIEGQSLNLENLLTLSPVPRAGNGGVTVSRFVWFTTAPTTGNQSGDTASQNIFVSNTQTVVNSTPDAFAYSVTTGVITTTTANSTMTKQAGDMVESAIAGAFLVKLTTNSTQGQKVFANILDGTMQSGTAGATIAGYVETSYKITLGGTAGTLVVMTKLLQV